MVSKPDLAAMDPYEFEELIASVWEAKGFETTVTKGSRDRGVDIVAEKPGWKEVIQAKRYGKGNKVGSQKVREYATLYTQEPTANVVVIVTSGEFTAAAERLADDLHIEVIAGDELIAEIEQYDIAPEFDFDHGGEAGKSGEDAGPYVSRDFNEECEYCGTGFSNIIRLRSHLLNNHESELHECSDCGEVFIEASSLERHKNEAQHGGRDKETHSQIKCEFCTLTFESDPKYWKHLTNAHDSELAFCHSCKDHFRHERNLREHLYQEHDPADLGRIDQRRMERYIEENDLGSGSDG